MAVTGSFKTLMIGRITDSFVGRMQIHRKGDTWLTWKPCP
jgi:hypothetical protein